MISTFFINRPIFATVTSIMMVVGGIIAMMSLPIEQYPTITPPTVVVSASYPGASASTIADMVASPIEQQVNGVEGMTYMSSSSSSSGDYQLTITFDLGTDIDIATVLVQNRVNIAMSNLPEEVTQLGVTTQKQSTNVVMFISLTSSSPDLDALFLSNYASLNIVNELSRLPSVGNVQSFGSGDYSMRVWLDPDLMMIRGVTPEEVAAAIQSQNIQVAAGSVGSQPLNQNVAYTYTIQTEGLLVTTEQFGNIIIKTLPGGKYLRLKDIAKIDLGREYYNYTATLEGKDVAAIGVYQLPGGNALEVSKGVRAKMAELAEYFPPGLDYNVTLDTTEFIHASISDIYSTLITAFVLVLIVVLFFLQNWRATLIPMIAIPVSLIGTFIVMAALGFTINTLTLFGMVLAIGLVVDDAIIIVENSYRLIETGKFKTVKEAVIEAMNEVSGTIVSIVLVLLAVFIPTAFISGITGQLYKQFALTIAIAVAISGFNALTLSPALCALFLKPKKETKFFLYVWFNKVFGWATDGFVWIVRKFLEHSVVTLFVFLCLSALAFWGMSSRPKSFLPVEDQGYFFVSMQLADGASLTQTLQAHKTLASILDTLDGVDNYLTIGGFSLIENAPLTNTATIFVMLKNWSERKGKELSATAISNRLNGIAYYAIPESQTYAMTPPAIPGLGESSGFQVMIEDINALGAYELQNMVDIITQQANQTTGLTGVNSEYSANVPQYYLDIDRDKVEFLGINLQDVFGALSSYLGNQYVNNFVKFNRIYQVHMAGTPMSRTFIESLRNVYVSNSDGQMIPFTAFSTAQTQLAPELVTRYNTYVAALISGSSAAGYSSGQGISAMESVIKEKAGKSFGYQWTSLAYQEESSTSTTTLTFVMAILFAYFIMAAKYESWTSPVAVILGLPIAVLGVVLGCMAMGLSISVYTQIGIVLLIGLAAKNAILIVEFARDYRAAGQSITDAALEAGKVRLRPILMTSFAFILGTFPLVVATGAGAASRISLGIAVFAGMTMTSFVGTLFMPNFYKLMQEIQEKWFTPKSKENEQEPPKEDTVI
ncbi:MAG: efflux RND transporter permease subunit [Marinifilaceae bacterium]